MLLKEIAGKLKVGDVVWLKCEVTDIGDQNAGLENRHFDSKVPFPNSMLGADVYGRTEVVLERPEGITDVTEIKIKETTKDEKYLGMVEAYEKVLFGNKKLTLE